MQVRATDDSLNIGQSSSRSLATSCPCSVWGAAVPAVVDAGSDGAVNLGMRFSPSTSGFALGVRFYKSAANTGTHTGALWTSTGQLLASGTFSNETASGWQEMRFAAPVDLTAGTEYVVSYNAPTGHYANDSWTFSTKDVVASPLTAPRSTSTKGNGVFSYGAQTFPTQSFKDTNYGVDVLFDNRDTYPPVATSPSPASGASSVPATSNPSAVLSKQIVQGSLSFTVSRPDGSNVLGSVSYNSGTRTATFTPTAALARGVQYTAAISATDLAGNTMPTPYTWSFTTMAPDQTPFTCPCSLWNDSTVPANVTVNEAATLELGTRFTADTKGVVSGVRFYKGPQNTGLHSGSLWDAAGNLLASATFANESTSGWQSVYFSQPVSLTPGTSYLVSYKTTVGYYSADWGMFATAGVETTPLHAPVHGGAYAYGGGFPGSSSDANYWVDPIFTVPASMPPVVASVSPSDHATNVASSPKVRVTFDAAIRPGSAAVVVTGPAGPVVGDLAYDSTTRVSTWTPAAPLADGTPFTVTVSGATNLGGTAMPAPVTSSFTTAGVSACPCTLFPSDAQPAVADANDGSAVTLGVKFTPAVDGYISAVKFYKSAANTGTHTATLWSSTGTSLGTATFTGESATGWQTATFSQPVAVSAETTYVASYYAPNGHYSLDQHAYDTAVTLGPLTAPGGANGVNRYGTGFPTDTYLSSGYRVTPVFQAGVTPDTTPPTVSTRQPSAGAVRVDPSGPFTATFSEPVRSGATFSVKDAQGAVVAGATSYNSASKTLTFTPTTPLAASSTYTAAVSATDTAGNAMASPDTWSFTVNGPQTCPCSLFGAGETPTSPDVSDSSGAVQLGVALTPTSDGEISAVKFWKGSGNTGTHTGSLWSASGQQLATGVFANETASGWQTLVFAAPVAVTAGTTYVASYGNSTGDWSATFGQFDTAGFTWPPLSVGPQAGRFVYGAGNAFPSNPSGANYWVDVVFGASTQGPPTPGDTTPPVVSNVAVTPSGTSATVTWTTDESSTSSVAYGTTSALGADGQWSLRDVAFGHPHRSDERRDLLVPGHVRRRRRQRHHLSGRLQLAGDVRRRGHGCAGGVERRRGDVRLDRDGDLVDGRVGDHLGRTTAPASALGSDRHRSVRHVALGHPHRADERAGLQLPRDLGRRGGQLHDVPGRPAVHRRPSPPPTPSRRRSPGSRCRDAGRAATITWSTDESSSTSVGYGTTASLGQTATGAAGTSHSVTITGLADLTTYYYRVTSADASRTAARRRHLRPAPRPSRRRTPRPRP